MMRILFVCTGNTCRSAMAEAIFKSQTTHDVRSAGVAAFDGDSASDGASASMKKRDLCLDAHSAQALSRELIDWADLVLTMTRRHQDFVVARFPEAQGKTFLLKEYALDGATGESGLARRDLELRRRVLLAELEAVQRQLADYDVTDPFGQGEAVYDQCADELGFLLARVAARIDENER